MPRCRFRCSDFGLDDEVIESLFLLLDTNMDGAIDLDEFINGWRVFQERSGVSSTVLPEPTLIELASLEAAVKHGLEQGKAVLICDPTERAAGFLAYNAVCVDCKGTFVLDHIHGKPPREIKEKVVCVPNSPACPLFPTPLLLPWYCC
jgi:hypothetical protein